MHTKSRPRQHLSELALKWEEKARFDERDYSPYGTIINEILFHADLRFHDYLPYQNEGEFPVRLNKWLDNVSSDRHKQILLKILRNTLFIDRTQMLALCRDAFHRIITPWLSAEVLTRENMLSNDYDTKIHSLLREYLFYSITESFNWSDFLHVNNLSGLQKPSILGENKSRVKALLPQPQAPIKGLIILEDFVGTGYQASNVLKEVRSYIPTRWNILFVPLIILESGLKIFMDPSKALDIDTRPVLVVSESECIREIPTAGERLEFKKIRSLVTSAKERVLEHLGTSDDPPKDPFGYGGSGAMVVTCHNVPNNTLSLIHHRAPHWFALFRRIHHSKDGLR